MVKSNLEQKMDLTKEQKAVENLQKSLSDLDEFKQKINEQQANVHVFFTAQDRANVVTEMALKSILHLLEKQKETVEQV